MTSRSRYGSARRFIWKSIIKEAAPSVGFLRLFADRPVRNSQRKGHDQRGCLVTTYHEEHTRTGMRSWSRTRWLVTAMIVAAIAIAVVLIVLYSGGGGSSHGGGGGY